LYNPAPPVARLTPDFLDSHIPQDIKGAALGWFYSTREKIGA
jgi:hypothetical protein